MGTASGFNQGPSGYNQGWENFYKKDLSAQEKKNTYSKLTGKDEYTMAYLKGDKQAQLGSMMMNGVNALKAKAESGDRNSQFAANLFENFAKGNSRMQSQFEGLQNRAADEAYKQALQHNMFKHLEYTPEELQAQIDKTGRAPIKDWDKWEKRENALTGDQDWVMIRDRPTESNFYRRYKKQIIQGAAAVGGFLVGGPAGALSAASLAGTLRDAYAARVDKAKIKDAKRDWENAEKEQEAQRLAELEAKKGNIYRGAGEGVVEYRTADKTKASSKKDTYVRE